jgi:hypothetical protein
MLKRLRLAFRAPSFNMSVKTLHLRDELSSGADRKAYFEKAAQALFLYAVVNRRKIILLCPQQRHHVAPAGENLPT